MNTVQKNFTLTEGARSRITVRLPEDVDPNNYEVYAGNDRCKCRHLVYGDPSVGEHSISLISEPAPQGCPIPYQIFIKDKTTDVEWLVVSGQVTVLNRYIGIPGISTEQFPAPIDGHDMEVEAPVAEETIEINVEVTYTQADLDEAVRQARQAAAWSCAYKNESCAASAMASCYMTEAQSAKTSACAAASTAMGWSECANTAANTAHSWADCALAQAGIAGQERTSACSAAATAITYSDCASNAMSAACTAADTAGIYKGQACGYSTCAINQATLAGASRDAACSAAGYSFAWKQESCAAASTSCTYADAASTSASTAAGWATCAQTQAASAMDWSAIAKQWALGQPSEPTGNSSKYWANQAATVVTGAAQRAENNTFTQTNTFNGTVALNGPIQGTGAVGGSVLAADEAVAFGIGKGLFERDSRVAPATGYVIYGPNTDSQPALLSMPTVPASSEERVKVYKGNIPPRYMVLRGNWPTNAFGTLTQTGNWNWTTTKEVDEVHIYWPGQTQSSDFFRYLHTRRLVLDLPKLNYIRATGSLTGSTAREIVAITPALVSASQTSVGLIHFGNSFSQDVSIDWTAENLTTLSGHVYPATYPGGRVVGCRLRWPSLSSAPNMFQWGSKFSQVPQADWYYTLSYLPDWTESTTEAYRTAITQYNAANPDTPITVEDDATLAELYAAVEEHNTQYPDSECTVTQPHPIGLAAVENCYAAVAQWLDDGGIPYTREPGHAPVAVLPYGWSISYKS